MGGGYIKIHRKLLDWQWHDIPEMVTVWMHLLLDASYEKSEWRGVVRERGQLTIGLRAYSKRCGMSIQSLRTCLQRLISTHEITSESTNQYTLITITQYDSYQTNEKESTNGITIETTIEQQTNNKRITNEQHISKKLKNIRNKEVCIFTPPCLEEVVSYCKERKNRVDPSRFIDFYTSKGWMVGKNKMKDWQSAVRNWEKNDVKPQPQEHQYRMEP